MADTNTTDPNQTEPQADTGAQGADPTPNQAQQQNGGPDAQKAAEGYRQQRDEARAEVAKLQKQLEELQAKGDPETYKAQLEEAKKKAEQDAKQAEFRRVNSVRLIKEGCVDVDVALTLLDENGDVDALRDSKPWLFGSNNQGSTGFKPSGSAKGEFDAIDKAMGVKPH